ncbi:MAG: TlpA family protein disulfide reductase [candidate division NC10 bacterium]|nr:TlpA family protein disulfide reductase [candidate division NC10 bacterium]
MQSTTKVVTAFLLCLISATFITGGHAQPLPVQRVAGGVAGPQVGQLAPEFALQDLDGTLRRLSDYRGKVVLLNFWSTWCTPCREEMPSMQRVYERLRKRGFDILAVSLNVEGKPPVEAFMKELKLSFPALLDPKKEAARLYRIYALPTTFLLEKDGKIAYKLIGVREWDDPDSLQLIEGLLREK